MHQVDYCESDYAIRSEKGNCFYLHSVTTVHFTQSQAQTSEYFCIVNRYESLNL